MEPNPFLRALVWTAKQLGVLLAAAGLTTVFFLVLPLLQVLSKPPTTDLMVTSVDTAELPPPPPVVEEEPEPEPEQEEAPPELESEAPPLDLAQLELALNPGGMGDGFGGADFSIQLGSALGQASAAADTIFSLADLDQKPRATYQTSPTISKKLRKQTPATVYVIFTVDERGRVVDPKVQKSTNPAFDRSAVDAIKKWRFEPGKRNGEPVQFRMRQPITFPKT